MIHLTSIDTLKWVLELLSQINLRYVIIPLEISVRWKSFLEAFELKWKYGCRQSKSNLFITSNEYVRNYFKYMSTNFSNRMGDGKTINEIKWKIVSCFRDVRISLSLSSHQSLMIRDSPNNSEFYIIIKRRDCLPPIVCKMIR